MDSRYHEFVWLTVKEYCTNCAIGSAMFALVHVYFVFVAKNIAFLPSFTLCILFAMVFVIGNRAAHYIAKMIQLEREEAESTANAAS